VQPRRNVPITRSQNAFDHGERGGVIRARTPRPGTRSRKAPPKMESRSWTKKRRTSSLSATASTSCGAQVAERRVRDVPSGAQLLSAPALIQSAIVCRLVAESLPPGGIPPPLTRL